MGLGAHLAEHARRRLSGYPCTVEVGRFEDAALQPESFDLIAAGAALAADPRFTGLEEHSFTETLEFDAPRFIDLLGTYSDHALLDSASRDRLEAAIAELVDTRCGGKLLRRAVTRLFLARRA